MTVKVPQASTIPLEDPVQLPCDRPILILGNGPDADQLLALIQAVDPPRQVALCRPTSSAAAPPEETVLVIAGPDDVCLGSRSWYQGLTCGGHRDQQLIYDAQPLFRRLGDAERLRSAINACPVPEPEERRFSIHDEHDFARLPGNRALYVFGAGRGGAFVHEALKKVSRPPIAFLDSYADGRFDGMLVIPLSRFLSNIHADALIILASRYWAEMDRTLLASGIDDAVNAFPYIQRRLMLAQWHQQVGQ